MRTYRATCWGQRYAVRADWARPENNIASEGEDGDWPDMGIQVATHGPADAMRELLRRDVQASGADDPRNDDDIDQAVEDIAGVVTYVIESRDEGSRTGWSEDGALGSASARDNRFPTEAAAWASVRDIFGDEDEGDFRVRECTADGAEDK